MDTLEYSIVYAVIRPEIRERISVGIIFCQEGDIEVRYSNVKLDAVKNLLPESDYKYVRRTLWSMSTKGRLESVANIDYLNRYSNNILTVSEIKKVRMDSSKLTRNKLYKMYVHDRQLS